MRGCVCVCYVAGWGVAVVSLGSPADFRCWAADGTEHALCVRSGDVVVGEYGLMMHAVVSAPHGEAPPAWWASVEHFGCRVRCSVLFRQALTRQQQRAIAGGARCDGENAGRLRAGLLRRGNPKARRLGRCHVMPPRQQPLPSRDVEKMFGAANAVQIDTFEIVHKGIEHDVVGIGLIVGFLGGLS